MKKKFTIIEKDGVKRVDFWSEHWYEIPGKTELVPSVTMKLSDVVSKGYGYEKWLKDTGNESVYISRQAAESGSRLHEAIEHILKGGEITAENGEFDKFEWKKLNDWLTWWKDLCANHKVEIISIEAIVYDEKWNVAGTADLIVKIDGVLHVIDWKTGNNVYPTHRWQIGSYAKMAEAPKAWIVHVGAKNKSGIKVHEVDVKKSIKMFDHVVALHAELYPNKKAPTSEYPLTLSLDG